MRDSLSVLHGQIATSVPDITAAFPPVMVEPIHAAGNNPASQDIEQLDPVFHKLIIDGSGDFHLTGANNMSGTWILGTAKGSWSGTRQ